ncbi:MAG: DUF952 domain-containing protein [Acidimicrobiales bacterium]
MTGAILDPDGLYHLASTEEWGSYQAEGRIGPPSLDVEGFVHCSWGRQVRATVERHFPDAKDVLALRIDPSELRDMALVEEDSYGSGQAFPHVYGPVPVVAVVGVVAL